MTAEPPKPVPPKPPRLPWFLKRMTGDDWLFGLLTSNGMVVVITKIDEVYQTAFGTWLDVELATAEELKLSKTRIKHPCFVAPTERTRASINLATVVAAFDMQGSKAVAGILT